MKQPKSSHTVKPSGKENGVFSTGGFRASERLDISWLRDESLEESDNLPDPDVLSQDFVRACNGWSF